MTTTNTLRLDAIVASKTNPRKHFDKTALQELAESIAKHGVLQAILVRPNGAEGKFELVAGERRWRAASIAKLERIPVSVRELTDAEALEIQVVENLQREGLHPLEEAEGYESLLRFEHADGRAYTVDEIAAKVGKSRSYVYQRLKLTALTPKAREDFYEGRLDASRALLIARVPADLQEKAIARILADPKNDWDTDMSFREARDCLHREFMTDLGKPPFDVRAIYFVSGHANPIGVPCAECPKRTGNQPELFEDVKSGDVCTDPACYQAKTAAHVEKVAEEKRAKGQTVLTGKEAEKVLPNGYGQARGGYVRLDAVLDGDPKYDKLSKHLGKKLPPVTLIENPREPGEFIKVVEEKAARELLVAAGHKWADKEARKAERSNELVNNARTNKARETESAVALAIHQALREAVRRDGLTAEDLRDLIAELRDNFAMDEEIESLSGPTAWDDTNKAPAGDLQPMVVDCMFPWVREELGGREVMAKRHGIDVAEIERQVKAELKAKAAAEKEAQKTATPAGKKGSKKVTQEAEA